MRIIVDAMGGDNAPDEIIKGCIQVADKIDGEIILVGKEQVIKEKLNKFAENKIIKNINIHNANDVITNEDSPVKAVKTKTDSSMVIGFNLLKQNKGNVFLSAGNTGALMTAALFNIGRVKGVSRPALGPIIPSKDGKFLLLDAGSNTNCKPENLLQFAVMGSIYMQTTMKIEKPRVGLINIGAEESKGSELTKQTYQLLKSSGLNFIGNVEGRDLMNNVCDVAVCDGFVGNVILKTMEGFGLSIFKMLKEEISSSFIKKLGAIILKPTLLELRKKLDYTEYGGALLLGIDGPVIKCHGNSNAKSVAGAILQSQEFAKNGCVERMREEFERIGVESDDSE